MTRAFLALALASCVGAPAASTVVMTPREPVPVAAPARAEVHVRFEGVREVSEADLRAVLEVARRDVTAGKSLSEVIERDAQRVHAKLHDLGYIQSQSASPRVEVTAKGTIVTFAIDEGARYRVAKLEVRDSSSSTPRVREVPHVKPGDWFSRSLLDTALAEIEHAYADAGHGLVGGRLLWKLHVNEREVDLVVEITPGRTYSFGDLRVVPAEHAAAILERARAEGVVPGAAYEASKVDRVKRAFSAGSINVVRQESKGGDRIDLLFEANSLALP